MDKLRAGKIGDILRFFSVLCVILVAATSATVRPNAPVSTFHNMTENMTKSGLSNMTEIAGSSPAATVPDRGAYGSNQQTDV